MAWSTPSALSTGTLVTAATWNQDVKDNAIALRAGAVALTSQAAGDVIVASSTTQFGRVAPGTSGNVLTSNGSAWTSAAVATATSLDTGTVAYSGRTITVDTGGSLDIVLASAAGDDLTIDTSKLVVEGDTGNVGIGVTDPDGTLHVHTATAGSVGATAGADDLVVENSTHAGMTFLSPSGNYQQTIAFGDVGDADSGRIQYDHDSNVMSFWTEGTSRVTISSAGRVKMPAVYSVSGTGAALYIESDGNLFRIVSARRYKENIDYDNVNGDAVYDFRPVTYTLKDLENPVEQVGFIAEDVEEIDPRLVVYSKEGTVDALHYDRITVLLVKAMQDLKANYDAAIARIAALEN